MTLTIGMWGNCYIISIIKDLLAHNFLLLSHFEGSITQKLHFLVIFFFHRHNNIQPIIRRMP